MALFKPQGKHKRKILFYSLAMILPGIILCIVAFRGIIGNMAMAEKNQIQKLGNISQEFYEGLEKSFLQSVKLFPPEELDYDSGFSKFKQPSKGNEFRKNNKYLCIITWLPGDGVYILNHSTLFVPNTYWNGNQQKVSSISLQTWSMTEEFENNNYYEALKKYKEVFRDSSSNKLLQTQSLMSQARIQHKLNQFREAKRLYRDVFEFTKDPEILAYQDSIPRQLMAEMITTWITRNEFLTNAQDPSIQIIDILAFLSVPQTYLTEENYMLCLQECQNQLQILKNGPSEPGIDLMLIDSLLGTRQSTVHKQNKIIHIFPQIIKVLDNEDIGSETISQHNFVHNEDSVSLYTVFSTGRHRERMALTLDLKELLKEYSNEFFNSTRYYNSVHWQLRDHRERIINSSAGFNSKVSSYSLPPFDQGMGSLHLQYTNLGWFRRAFSSNQGIYFVLILFVILGLGVGLVITLRGLANENRLARLKSDFISSVSHELKSPVTSIRQMSELLERGRIQSEDRKLEYYSTMVAQSERLSHVVDNILDFSRLEYGAKKLKLEPTRLDQLLKDVLKNFEIRLRYTGYNLKYKIDENIPIMNVDQEGFRQVFYNLLDNAYKYSGGSRDIELTFDKLDNGIQISFKDYGIGIHPKDQKRIFERYFRGHINKSKEIKGNGIGLAIVLQVVKSHNGRLEVKSELGKGSTFTVIIPFSKTTVYEKNTNS